jgi:ketosteroid isomerase-like protein
LSRLDSYHFYGPKFTKFAAEVFGRQDAAAARKGEHDGSAAVNDLKMQADDLKIDVFGDAAIATFILNYSFKTGTGTIEKKARSTMVFVKDRGTWKITHEHFSAPKSDP